jgi:4-amino-4-deoxy-L-arabinose transferase-like glycosyltransferase
LSTLVRGMSFVGRLACITAFGFGVRVAYVLAYSDRISFGLDSVWYQLVSGTLVSGDGYVDPEKFYGHGTAVATAFRPPLYPVFLAAVTKTVGGSQRTFQLVGCAIGLITIVLIAQLGRRLGGDAVGLCAAALAAVYPVFIAVDASVMSETIYLPLVTGCVLAVYCAIDKPTVLRWALVGLLAGAAVLTRGDGVVLVAVLVIPAALFGPRAPWRRRLLLAASAALVVGIVLAPWMLRNHQRLGTFTIATLDPATAVAGTNCPATYDGPLLGSWSFECTQRPDQGSISEVAVSNELQRDGRRFVQDHLDRVPVVVAVRVLRLWGLYDPVAQSRQEAVESRSYGWQLVSEAAYLPVAILAAYGFVLLRRRHAQLLPMVAVLIAVTVTAALVYGKQRFRVSAEPVLLVAAAVAIMHIVTRGRTRRGGTSDS